MSSTDISKCFRGSLQLRDNESRQYFIGLYGDKITNSLNSFRSYHNIFFPNKNETRTCEDMRRGERNFYCMVVICPKVVRYVLKSSSLLFDVYFV